MLIMIDRSVNCFHQFVSHHLKQLLRLTAVQPKHTIPSLNMDDVSSSVSSSQPQRPSLKGIWYTRSDVLDVSDAGWSLSTRKRLHHASTSGTKMASGRAATLCVLRQDDPQRWPNLPYTHALRGVQRRPKAVNKVVQSSTEGWLCAAPECRSVVTGQGRGLGRRRERCRPCSRRLRQLWNDGKAKPLYCFARRRAHA
jgi:hypothetical protein